MAGRPKNALILGITGQDGSLLAKYLTLRGYQVYGTSRDKEVSRLTNLRRLGLLDEIEVHSANATEFHSVLSVIQLVRPDEIYNLAGQSSVALSFTRPLDTITSSALGVVNILEAIRFLDHPCKIFSACSGDCFGNTEPEGADERHAFRPRSPYGVGMAAAYWAVANYREAYDIHACSGLLFNHESPLRPYRFVTQKIVSDVVDIANGVRTHIYLGDVSVRRDWGWAPDYVDAMWRVLQHEQPEDFVISTNHVMSLAEFVEAAFEHAGLDPRDHIVEDEGLRRPTDVHFSLGNSRKAEVALGWRPTLRGKPVVAALMDAQLAARNPEFPNEWVPTWDLSEPQTV